MVVKLPLLKMEFKYFDIFPVPGTKFRLVL